MNTELNFFFTFPGTKTKASDIIRDTTGWVEYLSTTRIVRTRMDVIHLAVDLIKNGLMGWRGCWGVWLIKIYFYFTISITDFYKRVLQNTYFILMKFI